MLKKFIQNDFKALLIDFNKRGIIKLSTDNLKKLEKIHSISYSFALWDEKLSELYKLENKTIFISDLKSDLVQIMPLALLGYKKATAILLRSTIENVLRHIYFFDHKIEFLRYKNSGFYIKQSDYYDYLKNHPMIGNLCLKMNSINLLSSKYAELSEIIHGKQAMKKDFAECLDSIKFDQKFYEKCYEFILIFGNIYNFLFCVFHKDILKKFHNHSREFILSQLDKKAYTIFARG